MEIARNIEAAKENASKLLQTNHGSQIYINALNKNNQNNCNKCGQTHKTKCPALNENCHVCGKRGHFAKMCFYKHKQNKNFKSKYVKNMVCEEGEPEDLFVGSLSLKNNNLNSYENRIKELQIRKLHIYQQQPTAYHKQNKQEKITTSKRGWVILVKINNKNVEFQVDTGADTNILSEQSAKELRLGGKNLQLTKTNILTFSGEKLPVKGKVNIKLDFNNKIFISTFYTVNLKWKNIIGLDLARQMDLIKNINKLSLESILEKYSDTFNGLGMLGNKCRLVLRDNVKPVVDVPRKIPFALHGALKDELDRMEKLGVIAKIDEPTEWVNSIVLVSKPNGRIRLCLDPRNLNKAIVRPVFLFLI